MSPSGGVFQRQGSSPHGALHPLPLLKVQTTPSSLLPETLQRPALPTPLLTCSAPCPLGVHESCSFFLCRRRHWDDGLNRHHPPAAGLEHGQHEVLLLWELSWQSISSPCPRAKASDGQILAMLTGQRDTAGSVRDVSEHGAVQGGKGAAPHLLLTARCDRVCPHGSKLLGSAAQTGGNQVPARAPQGWVDEGLYLDSALHGHPRTHSGRGMVQVVQCLWQ